MALYHHSNQAYDEAAAEAANDFRARFDAQIARGRASTARVINKVLTEVPTDRIAAARTLEFVPSKDDANLYVEIGNESREVVTDHALSQLAERTKISGRYVTHLRSLGEFGRELLAHNLNKLCRNLDDQRFLTRSFDGRLRAVLSDSYRRLDGRPIVEAVAEEVNNLGGVFVEGQSTETKLRLQFLLPTIYEPVKNEPVVIGGCLGNSDYGDGAALIQSLIDRLWCTNKACTQSQFAQVHLGKRLADAIEFSQKTYELDTAATVSAIRDVVRAILSPPAIERQLAIIKQAHEEEVDPKAFSEWLKKRGGAGLAERALLTFNQPDVVNLPAGNSVWRASNALSLLARDTESPAEKIELERLAGEVLDRVKVDAPEVVEA